MSQIILKEGTAPGSPGTNKHTLYVDSSDSKLKMKDENGDIIEYTQAAATPDASETVKGIVERATDTEAALGTDTTRYLSASQIKKLGQSYIYTIVASNTLQLSDSSEQNGYDDIAKSFYIYMGGSIRLTFSAREQGNATIKVKVSGTEVYSHSLDSGYQIFTTDFSVSVGDYITLEGYGGSAYVKDLIVSYTPTLYNALIPRKII